MSTFQFCFLVFLDIHRHPKQKEFLKCYDAFLKKYNLSTFIQRFSTWTEPETFLDKVTWWHFQSTSKEVFGPNKF